MFRWRIPSTMIFIHLETQQGPADGEVKDEVDD
jgi:hypothetical protein